MRRRFKRLIASPPGPDGGKPFAILDAELREEAELSQDYLVLVVASCVIASLGLIANSAAVIIGAMIIAPLMRPIRSFAYGALCADFVLGRRGAWAIAVGCGTAIALSWLLGLIVPTPAFGAEVSGRTQPTLLDLGIALAAGGVSAYAKRRSRINDAMAGTAIAVALMPPLCVVGLCLSKGFGHAAAGAFLLFVTNLMGIALACMAVFSLTAGIRNLERSRPALLSAIALTALLALPLGYSLWELVRQAQLEAAMKRMLLTRTVTVGRQVELVSVRTLWNTPQPTVYLYVRANEPPTSRQVGLLETFVAEEMGRRFTLIFEVDTLLEVRASRSQTPALPPFEPPSRRGG